LNTLRELKIEAVAIESQPEIPASPKPAEYTPEFSRHNLVDSISMLAKAP
jgi:hypothetical protein